MNINANNHTFTAKLVSNGDFMQLVRDKFSYDPSAKRTLADTFATIDEAEKAAKVAFADCDELDHIVVVEFDDDMNFVNVHV